MRKAVVFVVLLVVVAGAWGQDYSEIWNKASRYDREGFLAGFNEGMGIALDRLVEDPNYSGHLPQWAMNYLYSSTNIPEATLFKLIDQFYLLPENAEKTWGNAYIWALNKWMNQ